MTLEIFQLEFIRNSVVSGILIGTLCGVIGSLIVVNRIVFLAGGIAHTAYGGIGLTYYLGLPFYSGTICFSIISALLMAKISLSLKHRSDTIIGVMWAAGMSIGIIFLDLTPGYNTNLMSYLFGSILAIPQKEVKIIFILTLIVISIITFFYKKILSISYDEEFSRIQGLKVSFLYYLIIVLISISVVMIVKIVGLIMVISMLTIGPYIAEKFATSLKNMMIFSSILNIIFVIIGLYISYFFNLTPAACIIVSSVAFFIILVPINYIILKNKNL